MELTSSNFSMGAMSVSCAMLETHSVGFLGPLVHADVLGSHQATTSELASHVFEDPVSLAASASLGGVLTDVYEGIIEVLLGLIDLGEVDLLGLLGFSGDSDGSSGGDKCKFHKDYN